MELTNKTEKTSIILTDAINKVKKLQLQEVIKVEITSYEEEKGVREFRTTQQRKPQSTVTECQRALEYEKRRENNHSENNPITGSVITTKGKRSFR